MRKVLFLTWIAHRRTRGLCERLDIPLVELVSPHRGLLRYLSLTARSVRILFERRPDVLLVQNPSLVLTLLGLLLRPLLRYRLIVDAHNEGVEPYLHPSQIIRRLTYRALRKADCTIVSNRQLAAIVARHNGSAQLIPDGLPTPPATAPRPLAGSFRVVLISTFAGDEPFANVIAAARQVGDAMHFYVTGNPSRLAAQVRNSLPANMTLMGFLSEDDYWGLLASCDAVMDLTTMDNCLVCGAYEAIAVNRPLLLSRSAATAELFGDFAVLSDNEADALVTGLAKLRSEHPEMLARLPHARRAFEDNWARQAGALRALLHT